MAETGKPTARGARRCAEWLRTCHDLGWKTSDMPALADLFWKYKDENGNLKPPVPPAEVKP